MRFNVVVLSQPVIIEEVVYEETTVPPEVIILPFHVYGSSLAHIVIFCVAVSTGLTIKFKVVVLSHPVTKDGIVNVAAALPPEVTVMPFQLYGS